MADQFVYIRDDEFHWVPGLLVETTNDSATVAVARYNNESEISGGNDSKRRSHNVTVKLKDYPNKALPLQNVHDGKVNQVPDMIELSFLHEAAILYNLKDRHVKGHPYTRTGDIVIAVNPYRWFKSLYTEENRTNYSRALVWEAAKKDYDPRKDLPPHVYETSALSYKGLSLGGMDQSILVSGESGAGKTETVKICMNHLASVVQQEHQADGNTSQDQQVITRILDSNPLLEAFGNAKTRRNDNSSRFGKYVRLQFQRGANNPSHLTLVGSESQVYLLEKSRVVNHDEAERTFHIFYQLLAAPDSIKGQFWDKLKGTTYASFAYVGETDTTSIEGVSDEEQFRRTLKSLSIIGIQGQLLSTFMTAICVVLQLGNIFFGPSPEDSDHSVVTSTLALNDLADLMGIPSENLRTTLTKRLVKVRKEETMVPQSPEAAKDSANALAKQIYDRTFLWLVRNINAATTAGEGEGFGIIGLLDIFGFESFPVNSFEQLCINYANERLQQKFTKDVFVSVFEEYKDEGISLDEIKYDDNTHVLDLIQNKTGLLAMLNEECIRPNGSDYGFVNKALHANKSSPALIIPRIVHSDVEFGIRHYAGDVLYDATDFVTKNQDTLPSDLLDCARTSTNDIIAKELAEKPTVGGGSKPRRGGVPSRMPSRKQSNLVAPTAWSKYKEQLSRLMTELHKSDSKYIRCVKPNIFKKPGIMEHGMTLQQLRSSGVIAAVTLARSAFPNRLEHHLVLDRFYPLWPASIARNASMSNEKQCEMLLSNALKPLENDGVKAFVIGRSRAYFRAGALEYLEAYRLKGMEGPATKVQATVRGFLARRLAYRIRHKAELEEFALKAESALPIQCAVRSFLARKERENRYVQYMKDQAKLLKKKKKLKKLGIAATRIQRIMRGAYVRMKYKAVFEKSRERSALRAKIEKLSKKIAKSEKAQRKEIEKAKKGVDMERAGREAWEESVLAASTDAAENEKTKMIEYLQNEHRKLQIKSKTLDGMLKPLKKNFDALMEENKMLRQEFAEIHKKNEDFKKRNKELIERRDAAGKKTKSLKDELKSVSNKFMPVAHGRLDYQKALKEIMEMLETRCKNGQLVEDATLIAYECHAEASSLQAGVDAAELELSPKRRAKQRMGASMSNLGSSFSGGLSLTKTPQSARAPGSKKNRRSVQAALNGVGSLVSPGVHKGKGKGKLGGK
mmetsp:Transcript_17422/g.26931  ORF Transcript_17422/g.26931 Transcript_17422/m.26931 type:complete len:1192 (+) Transcript_17422:264-3839(+)